MVQLIMVARKPPRRERETETQNNRKTKVESRKEGEGEEGGWQEEDRAKCPDSAWNMLSVTTSSSKTPNSQSFQK